MSAAATRLEALVGLLREHDALLGERLHGPEPSAWCDAESAHFLGQLDDPTLLHLEREGAGAYLELPGCPEALRSLAMRVRELCRLERLAPPLEVATIASASDTKRAQIAALVELVAERFSDAERVVELGAGRGHATRALAGVLDRAGVGVERRAEVTLRARALTDDPRVSFVCADANGDDLALSGADLLVGLHACGGLGDHLVAAAAAHGSAVLHVGCCPQKIDGDRREGLSEKGRALGFAVDRVHLGLANLVATPEGETPMIRRERRHALYLLLRARGVALAPGDEARGIARRQFRHELSRVAGLALERRGLSPPSPSEIVDFGQRASEDFASIRRHALPRRLLSRPLELAIAFDRAAALEEAGRAAEVLEVFAPDVSPRNVAVLADARAPGAGLAEGLASGVAVQV